MWLTSYTAALLALTASASGDVTLGSDLPLGNLEPVLSSVLPVHSVMVPLGEWSPDNLDFLCGDLLTDGCTFVNNDHKQLAPLSKSSAHSPITWFNSKKTCKVCSSKESWYHSVPYSPVDKNRTKVFLMSSSDQVSLAERICDADFFRHCLGVLILSDKFDHEEFKGSNYMPIIQILSKDDHVLMSVKYEACVINDTNFALYNLTSGKLTKKFILTLAVNCKRNIRQKTLKTIDAYFYPADVKLAIESRVRIKHYIQKLLDNLVDQLPDGGRILLSGKASTKYTYYGLYAWFASSDSLMYELSAQYQLPSFNATRNGPFKGKNSVQATLLRHLDAVTWTASAPGSRITIDHEGDTEPHLINYRYGYGEMSFSWAVACPLPTKVPALYNIVMLLSVNTWAAVAASIVSMSAGFIIINEVYKMSYGAETTLKWYEIPLIVVSILFAEARQEKWCTKGVARIFLTIVWELTAMFIVFIFLCNLRAVLLKPNYTKVPRNLQELVESSFDVYVSKHRSNILDDEKEGRNLHVEGRILKANGNVEIIKKHIPAGNCGTNFLQNFNHFQTKEQIKNRKSLFKYFQFKENKYFGWWMLKSHPYREMILKKFDQMAEAGLIAKIYDIPTPFIPVVEDPLVPLDLGHFFLTLIGIAIGLGLAVASFVVERVRYKKQKGKKIHNQKKTNDTKQTTLNVVTIKVDRKILVGK